MDIEFLFSQGFMEGSGNFYGFPGKSRIFRVIKKVMLKMG